MQRYLSEIYWWWVVDVDTGIKDILKLILSIGIGVIGFYLAKTGYTAGYILMLVAVPMIAMNMADVSR